VPPDVDFYFTHLETFFEDDRLPQISWLSLPWLTVLSERNVTLNIIHKMFQSECDEGCRHKNKRQESSYKIICALPNVLVQKNVILFSYLL
jgi:hypothetical protein